MSGGQPPTRQIVLVPGVLALLPQYAGIEDPVADLRAAAREAVTWALNGPAQAGPALNGPALTGPAEALTQPGEQFPEVAVVASCDSARRVGAYLVESAGGLAVPAPAGGVTSAPQSRPILLVGNGSATRTEKAPGHLHPQAAAFDDRLDALLRAADHAGLAALDRALAAEVWADVAVLIEAAECLRGAELVGVDYDDDPFGVCYRVMRWQV